MATSTSGVKRSNSEIFTEPSPRPKKIAKAVSRFNPFSPLAKELWVKIFSFLVPGDIRPASLVCWEFSFLRLPSFYVHLEEKQELTSTEIRALHPPLVQFLIYNDDRFDKSHENQRKEIQRLWTDHSVQKIFPFIIFRCSQLQVLDLRDPRFSISTFLGDPLGFQEEVATLDLSTCIEYDQGDKVDPVVNPMLQAFDLHYPVNKRLPKVTVLKTFWQNDIEEDAWKGYAEIFPNLKTLILERKGQRAISVTDAQVKSITRLFPRLQYCTLIKINMVLLRHGSQSLHLRLEE